MNQVVIEGMLVIAAARTVVQPRPFVLARPRRGSADLPDRDAPDRTPSHDDVEPDDVVVAGRDRWIVPASVGLAAVIAGAALRTVALLI